MTLERKRPDVQPDVRKGMIAMGKAQEYPNSATASFAVLYKRPLDCLLITLKLLESVRVKMEIHPPGNLPTGQKARVTDRRWKKPTGTRARPKLDSLFIYSFLYSITPQSAGLSPPPHTRTHWGPPVCILKHTHTPAFLHVFPLQTHPPGFPTGG